MIYMSCVVYTYNNTTLLHIAYSHQETFIVKYHNDTEIILNVSLATARDVRNPYLCSLERAPFDPPKSGYGKWNGASLKWNGASLTPK